MNGSTRSTGKSKRSRPSDNPSHNHASKKAKAPLSNERGFIFRGLFDDCPGLYRFIKKQKPRSAMNGASFLEGYLVCVPVYYKSKYLGAS
jgi:hypothetical protein